MSLLDELKKPDDFSGTPYGYARNQLAHMMLPMLLAGFVLVSSKPFTGEIMSRQATGIILFVGALLWELWQNRKGNRKGWLDAAEDLLYLSYIPILCFSSIGDGTAELTGGILSFGFAQINAAYSFFMLVRVRCIERKNARNSI